MHLTLSCVVVLLGVFQIQHIYGHVQPTFSELEQHQPGHSAKLGNILPQAFHAKHAHLRNGRCFFSGSSSSDGYGGHSGQGQTWIIDEKGIGVQRQSTNPYLAFPYYY